MSCGGWFPSRAVGPSASGRVSGACEAVAVSPAVVCAVGSAGASVVAPVC